jgi:hypothetical protein
MLARQATGRTASLSNKSQTANRFVSTDLIMKTYDKDSHKFYGSLTFDRKQEKNVHISVYLMQFDSQKESQISI